MKSILALMLTSMKNRILALLALAALFCAFTVTAAHAADAVATTTTLTSIPAVGTSSVSITPSALANVQVTPQADGTVLISGLPASWQTLWGKILSIAGTVIIVARMIVKLTPTPADDTLLDKIITFLKHLGLSTPPDKPNS